MTAVAFEALGAILGLLGALMLATRGRRASWGWAAFLASNGALLAFAWLAGHRWLFALQVGFTITSCIGIWTHLVRPRFTWSDWRGDFDGNPTMWIMPLASWRGRSAVLHKMVAPDMPECFHTHPARAIRVVLWGGYDEEISLDGHGRNPGWRALLPCRPGLIGLVQPDLAHRIARLRNGRASYSLWLRDRKTGAGTRLVGSGWGEREGLIV